MFGVDSVRLKDVPLACVEAGRFQAFCFDQAGLPVLATVRFTDKRAGPALHRCLACPRCARPALVLRALEGGLVCAACRRVVEGRRKERTTRWWRKDDGDLTDRLIHQVQRDGATKEVAFLATSLARRDHQRAQDALRLTRSVLEVCDVW